MDLVKGSHYQINTGEIVEFIDFCPNPVYIKVLFLDPPKAKIQNVQAWIIQKLVSSPLPLAVGDRVLDQHNEEGDIISISEGSITIRKSDKITSHNLEYGMPKLKTLSKKSKVSTRGGKREGAGRKPSGEPPKERKAIQLDKSIAAKLPDLKMLAELLDEFRPIAESGTLRSQKLADFYKKLDSLDKIVNETM